MKDLVEILGSCFASPRMTLSFFVILGQNFNFEPRISAIFYLDFICGVQYVKDMKNMYVYIISNKVDTVFYVGVTSDLVRRVGEHKNKIFKGFTAKYNVNKLVYFEIYEDELTAIAREKELKHFKRIWKEELIDKNNPSRRDLYDEIIK